MPFNFFYYAIPVDGIESVALQVVSCIALGLFFAYAYQKTNNIWMPITPHYINNSIVLALMQRVLCYVGIKKNNIS